MKNTKEKIQTMFGWFVSKYKQIFNNNPWRWIPRDKPSTWYHTLLYRLHSLFFTRVCGFGYELIHFYRSYEPNWLAKITDPSYAFQLKVDEVIDNYLKENNVRLERGTWCDPGINTDYCFIIKKNDWTDDEKYNFKRGLNNAIYDVYGLGKFLSNSPRLWMNTKFGGSNWQYHFVSNFIHQTLYGDYVQFVTEEYFDNVYKEDSYDN